MHAIKRIEREQPESAIEIHVNRDVTFQRSATSDTVLSRDSPSCIEVEFDGNAAKVPTLLSHHVHTHS